MKKDVLDYFSDMELDWCVGVWPSKRNNRCFIYPLSIMQGISHLVTNDWEVPWNHKSKNVLRWSLPVYYNSRLMARSRIYGQSIMIRTLPYEARDLMLFFQDPDYHPSKWTAIEIFMDPKNAPREPSGSPRRFGLDQFCGVSGLCFMIIHIGRHASFCIGSDIVEMPNG